MTLNVSNVTVTGKGDQPVSEDLRESLRARMRAMLDGAGVEPEAAKEALGELEAMLASPAAKTLDSLSAESIAAALEKAQASLDPLEDGIMALGFSLDRRGKGKQCFEMGETRGILICARAMLGLAAANLRHAMGCGCNEEHGESESETIPPPAPEAAASEGT